MQDTYTAELESFIDKAKSMLRLTERVVADDSLTYFTRKVIVGHYGQLAKEMADEFFAGQPKASPTREVHTNPATLASIHPLILKEF